jgi:hypothetical protein
MVFKSMVDNYVTTTQLTNKAVSTHAELINTSLLQVGNYAREYPRIGINAAKNFHEAASEAAKMGFSAIQQQTTVSTQKKTVKKRKIKVIIFFYSYYIILTYSNPI